MLTTEPMPLKPRNVGGRPPLSREGSTVVSVRLANARYDALARYARAAGCDISEVIRRAIERDLLADRRSLPR